VKLKIDMKRKKEKIMLEISGKWELRGDRNVNVGRGREYTRKRNSIRECVSVWSV